MAGGNRIEGDVDGAISIMTELPKSASVYPVILSGGSGTRLWPLSRRESPKQFLPLVGEKTLLQDTARRVAGPGFAAPMVICNRDHRFLVAEQMRETGGTKALIVLEPAGRNTAPAAAVAALLASQADTHALVLLLPSDHAVLDQAAFEAAVAAAVAAAQTGAIVTFGIKPTGPETGYGYVQKGAPLPKAAGCFGVARFVEKPDRATAENYLTSGDYFWNSGMFLFSAAHLLAEMRRLQPAILEACEKAVAKGVKDDDFFRLDEAEFLACPSNSIDYAVMEHTAQAVVVPADMGWSDVGSWEALWNIAGKDDAGNAVRGDVLHKDVRKSYLHSDGPFVAAVGVENLVIVATADAVLVARRDASQDVKKIVDELERQGREEHIRHGGDKARAGPRRSPPK